MFTQRRWVGPVYLRCMISQPEATEQMRAYLDRAMPEGAPPTVITEARACPQGWLFFYQSAEYLHTQDVEDMLFGNAPVLIDHQGQVHVTGTAHPVDYYLARLKGKLC
jgi:hypothetical protein